MTATSKGAQSGIRGEDTTDIRDRMPALAGLLNDHAALAELVAKAQLSKYASTDILRTSDGWQKAVLFAVGKLEAERDQLRRELDELRAERPLCTDCHTEPVTGTGSVLCRTCMTRVFRE